MHFRTSKIKKTTQAFTLVEMMVALGIFSIVAVVALGALVKIISANKKAQTLQASVTNLNFALDSMSRELRVGTDYFCQQNPSTYGYDDTLTSAACSSGGSVLSAPGSSVALAFVSSKTAPDTVGGVCNLAIAYLFAPDAVNNNIWHLQKAVQPDCSTPISVGDFTDADIIDPEVVITGYYLNVVPTTYPSATLRISGYAGTREKEKTVFDIQTTVSARTK